MDGNRLAWMPELALFLSLTGFGSCLGQFEEQLLLTAAPALSLADGRAQFALASQASERGVKAKSSRAVVWLTSFAFIAGLLPLVSGVFRNRTIGNAAVGRTLVGILIGVTGHYDVFGGTTDKQEFIKDETDEPLRENFEREA